mgnify:CR=1 FL=1
MKRGTDGSTGWYRTTRDNDVDPETHQLSRERGEAIAFPLGRKPIDAYVFSLNVVKLAQTLAESLDAAGDT